MPRTKEVHDQAGRGRAKPRLRLSARKALCLVRRDRRGGTTVEFAIVLLPFLGLVFAILQTSFAFLVQQGLKAAVDSAARQVMTGSAQNNATITSWQNFRDQLVCPPVGSAVANLLPSFITCSNILVDVRPYASFTGMSGSNVTKSFLTDGSGEKYNPGSACQIVVVRAAYPMPVYIPLLSWTSLMGNVSQNTSGYMTYNGTLVQMISTASVFRNEPFIVTGNQAVGGC